MREENKAYKFVNLWIIKANLLCKTAVVLVSAEHVGTADIFYSFVCSIASN